MNLISKENYQWNTKLLNYNDIKIATLVVKDYVEYCNAIDKLFEQKTWLILSQEDSYKMNLNYISNRTALKLDALDTEANELCLTLFENYSVSNKWWKEIYKNLALYLIASKYIEDIMICDFGLRMQKKYIVKCFEWLKNNAKYLVTIVIYDTWLLDNKYNRPDCCFKVNDNFEIISFSNSSEKELREEHDIEKLYRNGAFE